MQHDAAIMKQCQGGAFRTRIRIAGHDSRGAPAPAPVARADDDVLKLRIFGRMQDEGAARSPVEHDKPVAVGGNDDLRMGAIGGDRKSTRLKSSHLGISYA